MKKRVFLTCALLACFMGMLTANPFKLQLEYEKGFVGPVFHQIQFGKTENGNTKFDYVKDGGQDILFPAEKFTLRFEPAHNHLITFVYQPLELQTKAYLTSDATINTVKFEKNSGLSLKYSFPFYRVSYMYKFINEKRFDIGAGLSLQLRNASISFESLDGKKFIINQNLGPVPILKFAANYRFENGIFFGTEVDGFYASSAFINGSSFDFEGSILDLNIKAGAPFSSSLSSFLNIRWLAGSAKGTEKTPSNPLSDGYTDNVLSFFLLTLGFIINI